MQISYNYDRSKSDQVIANNNYYILMCVTAFSIEGNIPDAVFSYIGHNLIYHFPACLTCHISLIGKEETEQSGVLNILVTL